MFGNKFPTGLLAVILLSIHARGACPSKIRDYSTNPCQKLDSLSDTAWIFIHITFNVSNPDQQSSSELARTDSLYEKYEFRDVMQKNVRIVPPNSMGWNSGLILSKKSDILNLANEDFVNRIEIEYTGPVAIAFPGMSNHSRIKHSGIRYYDLRGRSIRSMFLSGTFR